MLKFAEEEIVIPSGDFEGARFKVSRQPHIKHWFNAIDSGKWNRFVCTGSTQSGKSLCGYVIPIIYYLFEKGETVVCGVPQMIMAADKWKRDILPVIESSKYAQYLPNRGPGSRGGTVDTIHFTHGPILKFMSGAGDDKTRAGFTTKIVAITEVEGLDVQAMSEGEPDRIQQIEARTMAYGHRRRIFLECTTSSYNGRIWQEYLKGSQSQITIPCPHCQEFIVPLDGEGPDVKDMFRNSLQGWQDAKDEIEAEENSEYHCPKCRTTITEEERYYCNLNSSISHGNERTRTFSYRWSCFNNMFDSGSASYIGVKEFQAATGDTDEAQKEVTTYCWTMPHSDSEDEFESINVSYIRNRCSTYSRGVLPPCELVAVGVDVGKRALHYTVVGETKELTNHIPEYGTAEVQSEVHRTNDAVQYALDDLLNILQKRYKLSLALVDARYATDGVSAACRKHYILHPAMGMGNPSFKAPQYGKTVLSTNAHYYTKFESTVKGICYFVNASFWKGEMYRRFLAQTDHPGSLDLHSPHDQSRHLEFAKHLTAEEPVRKGSKTVWVPVRAANHWLDSTTYALCALHHLRLKMGGKTAVEATAEAIKGVAAAKIEPIKLNLTHQYRNRR